MGLELNVNPESDRSPAGYWRIREFNWNHDGSNVIWMDGWRNQKDSLNQPPLTSIPIQNVDFPEIRDQLYSLIKSAGTQFGIRISDMSDKR